MAYVDDFMLAVNEESPISPEALHRSESPIRMERMGIWLFYPVRSAERAASTPESLRWLLSVLCTLCRVDGAPGLVVSKKQAAC